LLNVAILFLLVSCGSSRSNCQPNWKITGFYTPVFSDFNQSYNQSVRVKDFKLLSFNIKFLKAVKTEGWGQTRYGWYLGYYANQWHKEKTPLNALGYPLSIGAIAVDNQLIKKGTWVTIPIIRSILKIEKFKAVDVGSAIKKQRIDIYTGEGKSAEALSYQVTGIRNVCFTGTKLAPIDSI